MCSEAQPLPYIPISINQLSSIYLDLFGISMYFLSTSINLLYHFWHRALILLLSTGEKMSPGIERRHELGPRGAITKLGKLWNQNFGENEKVKTRYCILVVI